MPFLMNCRLVFLLLRMKIKIQANIQGYDGQNVRKNTIANKENLSTSDYKPPNKRLLRSRSGFGQDITKRINEPVNSRYMYTTLIPEVLIELPTFLKKPTAFTSQISLYEEEIIEYIIQTNNQKDFNQKFLAKMQKSRYKRITIVQKLYKLFKRYRLRRKTLYLAVYYYDKYMSLISPQYETNITMMNIVSDACMLIAMKYEEIYPPFLQKWATGRQQVIINMQSKILLGLDFKLAQTTAQHYFEIYQGKNINQSEQQIKLHEIVLDLYLFTSNIYKTHPLKIVQEILESFRSTAFMQKGTNYEKSNSNVKQIIQNNQKVWLFLLQLSHRENSK